MAVNKFPGEKCYITIGSIDYIGPQVTVWLNAMVTQVDSIKYVSPTYQVNFAEASDWMTMTINIKFIMVRYSVDITAGLADCVVVMRDAADPAIAHQLYTQTWQGVFNFIYPASAWRGASGTFAAHVSGLNAQFGVNR